MSLPVLSRDAMRAWERDSWAAGRNVQSVIQRVGWRLARWLAEHSRARDSILLLAGPGHNGDDVRAAVPVLADRDVEIITVRDPSAVFDCVRLALRSPRRWVVDGLFGIGLNRPLDGAWRRIIEAVNACEWPVAAMDVPSGLDADSGQPLGEAIHATHTLTVGAPKPGLIVEAASPWVGRLEVLNGVGLIEPPVPATGAPVWLEERDFAGYPPQRASSSHKGSHGHAVILAGSLGYHGAAVLAARGALSMRPGLVTVLTLPSVYSAVAAQMAAPLVGLWKGVDSIPASATSLVVGPGLAAPECEILQEAIARCWQRLDLPMVVDASALAWLPQGRVESREPRLLTPHPGEAGRLIGITAGEVQGGRPETLREVSKTFGQSWVILKGRHTLIGRTTGSLGINGTGSPSMAQGGTGDVLAGMAGGLLAQREARGDLFKLAAFAAWEHGRRADLLDQVRPHWIAEDLAILGAGVLGKDPAFDFQKRPETSGCGPPRRNEHGGASQFRNRIKLLGDKSPKSNQKKASQKQVKANVATQKKNQAIASQQASKKK
ncbi:MAG: NAD(P)H-hydrate dehydratase [Verrucomicrobia bacterium]|nr:NAD(P)H-hydrate dehydratase [Verrucomicrobiota bacterium]